MPKVVFTAVSFKINLLILISKWICHHAGNRRTVPSQDGLFKC